MTNASATCPPAIDGRRALALSPSRAADFKQCPLLYRFRALDRLPEPTSRAQLRGTLVHAALEALYGLPQPERQRDTALAQVLPAWEALLDSDPALADVADGGFLDEAAALVTRYYTIEDPTRFSPQSCETRVELQLGDVPLRGIVDRIDVAPDGRIRVVDYKTGRSPGPLGENKALFQMKFYAVAIHRLRGVMPSRLRLIYLGDGKVLEYTPDAEELARFERTLVAIWTAIKDAGRAGTFEPKRSTLCQWCSHQGLCPEFGGTPPEYPGWPEPSHANPD